MRYITYIFFLLASSVVWSQPKFFIGMSIDSAESVIRNRYPQLPLADTPPSDSFDASYIIDTNLSAYGYIRIADRFAPRIFDGRLMTIPTHI